MTSSTLLQKRSKVPLLVLAAAATVALPSANTPGPPGGQGGELSERVLSPPAMFTLRSVCVWEKPVSSNYQQHSTYQKEVEG